MGLLEKFEKVEVKAEDRISPNDSRFCIGQQEAYDKGRAALKALVQAINQYADEQDAILSPLYSDRSFRTYLDVGSEGVKAKHVYDTLECTHDSFIHRIVSHFVNNYHVTIEISEITNALVPQRPSNAGWSRNDSEWAEYYDNLRNASLRYEDVLDHIFTQLGGYSFQDKAIKELKDACHTAAWNRYHGKKDYEQRKATISFTSYACHNDRWYSRDSFNLSDGLKHIVKALAYYEYNSLEYLGSLSELCGYSFDCPTFEFSLDKVKQVKCFRNGRVDIKFTSEKYARQFAEEFLGTEL